MELSACHLPFAHAAHTSYSVGLFVYTYVYRTYTCTVYEGSIIECLYAFSGVCVLTLCLSMFM